VKAINLEPNVPTELRAIDRHASMTILPPRAKSLQTANEKFSNLTSKRTDFSSHFQHHARVSADKFRSVPEVLDHNSRQLWRVVPYDKYAAAAYAVQFTDT
jgi:hypothetical protein